MKRKSRKFRDIILDMITTHAGSISSKIIVGTISYMSLLFSLIVLMFVNPVFPGLSDLITVLIVTSGSLLGLTTIENIKQKNMEFKTKLCTEDAIDTSLEEKEKEEDKYNPLKS